MKYKIVQENKPTLKNYGRYRAKAVYSGTVDTKQIILETCQRLGASEGTVVGTIIELQHVIAQHLRDGKRVRLDKWGLLKLELLSKVVDSPADFRPKEHIEGVRLHLLAESRHGRQPLYENIKMEREKSWRTS